MPNGRHMATREPFYYTKAPYWEGKKGIYLWVLQLLACFPLTGFFGLDHLFLRSPLTALAKAFFNIFGLGIWYIYDMIQVTVNRDDVESYGLNVPIFGPMGIGSGMFVKTGEAPSEDFVSPWIFMVYAILTLFPFGLDFFVAGDLWGGLVRLCTIMIPPLGFIWGCYNMYRAWGIPFDVMERGTYRPIPFTWWPFSMDEYKSVKGILGPGKVGDPEPACRPTGVIGYAVGVAGDIVKGLAEGAVTPVAKAAALTAAAPGYALRAAGDGIGAAVKTTAAALATPIGAAVKTAATVSSVGSALGSAGDAAVKAAATVPSAPERVAFPPMPIRQQGGSVGSPISDAALLFTLGLLVFGGGVLTLLRSRNAKYEPTKKNDAPPNPTAVRRTVTTS